MACLNLLVVEGDIPSLELMTEVFSSLKAEVVPVQDSREAVLLVDNKKFDGIFLDLEMPPVRGLELTERVHASSWNKSTPVIVVTGRDDRHAMQQAFSNGASFYMHKPVDRQKLTGLLRTVRGTLVESRRRYTRVPLHTEATCIVGVQTLRVPCRNLGPGGVQVEAAELKTGDAVRVSFRLPASNVTIEAFGTVVWATDNRRAIQFTRLGQKDEANIREFISRAEQQEWLPR
jgi:CheY-like chemotaxis protein